MCSTNVVLAVVVKRYCIEREAVMMLANFQVDWNVYYLCYSTILGSFSNNYIISVVSLVCHLHNTLEL